MKIVESSYSVFPSFLSAQGQVFVQYVLTQSEEVKDYAAYVGVVQDYSLDETGKQKEEALQWVAFHGNKLSYNEAIGVFPSLSVKQKDYRL